MSNKYSGHAFPITEGNGANSGECGMTLRDYFAAHAPHDIPDWFIPKIRPKPDVKWVDANGTEYPNRSAAEKAVGVDEYWNANMDATYEWQKDKVISTVAQWPWFWEDIQLEARNG